MKDLTFDGDFGKFNVRVAVLVEHNDKLLVQTEENHHWLIGGRIHFGETSKQAVSREISEELCYKVSDQDSLKLNFICENFFMWNKTPCHEHLFIYRLILSDNSILINKDGFKCGDNDRFTEKWIDFDELKNTNIVPKFIQEYIRYREFKFCIVRDGKISD